MSSRSYYFCATKIYQQSQTRDHTPWDLKEHPTFVFLPDHKKANTKLKNISTDK